MSDNVDDFLAHYGVRGMRWGKSKSGSSTSRKTNREAGKDATEFARAKMYYGEGAGVRRRLINNAVKSKSKDPAYKEAFDRNLDTQDLAKRGSEARSKRARTDAVNGTKKTTRGVINVMKGNMRYASAASIVLVGAAGLAHKTGVDKMLLDVGKTAFSAAVNDPRVDKIKKMFKER